MGYRYFDSFDKNVAYPFGFGLSYTSFEYSKPAVKVNGDNIIVNVTVKNTGKVAGKEIAQVYVAAPQGKIEKPTHELKGFAKTRELKPGESQVLTIQMAKRDLASFDEANSRWLVEAGQYAFEIGASSRDIREKANVNLTEYTEQVSNVLAPKEKLNLLRR